MKRTLKIVLMVLSIIILSRCLPDSQLEHANYDSPETESTEYIFEAMTNGETKTTTEGSKLLWDSADKLGVFSYTTDYSHKIEDKNQLFKNTSGKCTTAKFKGSLKGNITSNYVLAYYPYKSSSTIDGISSYIYLSGTLPKHQLQDGDSNNHLSSADFLYSLKPGNNDSRVLHFHHALSMLEFGFTSTTSGVYIEELEITGDNISGDFKIEGLASTKQSISKGSTTNNSITLFVTNCPELNRTTPFKVRVVVLPGNHYSMNMIVRTNKGVYKVSLGSKTLVAGVKYYKAINISSLTPPSTNLSETEMANCYIVDKSNTSYKFKATVRGNGVKVDGEYEATTVEDISSAMVIWESDSKGYVINNSSVKYSSDGYVSFTTSTHAGNAVIGVLNSSGDVLWSWLIWRPEDTPQQVPIVTAGTEENFYKDGKTYMIMDRNLGAINTKVGDLGSYGLLYQWGRKDPFIGPATANFNSTTSYGKTYLADGFSWDFVEELVNLTKSCKKCTTMYGTDGDWNLYPSDNWWGTPFEGDITDYSKYNTNIGKKTMVDPCPPGWRVPPHDTFSGLAQTTEDRRALLPVAGYRSLWFIYEYGIVGYYWTNSPHYAMNTRYSSAAVIRHTGQMKPAEKTGRGQALSVRCVREISIY